LCNSFAPTEASRGLMSRMRGDGAKAVALLAPALDLSHLTTGRDATSSVDAVAAKGWPAKLPQYVPKTWITIRRD
jgi:hypothetical protein